VSDRDPVLAFQREAETVAKKIHKVMSRVEFVEGSMVGTLAGILLYAVAVHRAAGLPHSALHTLIDAIDHAFAGGLVDDPLSKRDRDLAAAVKAADAEADRIIAKAHEAADKEENHE